MGGGIYNLVNQSNPSGTLLATNSTIAFNSAGGQGGGLQLDPNGTATFRNTIISNNTSSGSGPDVFGSVVSDGYNLVSAVVGSSGWSQLDLVGVDPMLAPLGNNGGSTNTHALRPGSVAIDHGSTDLARDPLTGEILLLD